MAATAKLGLGTVVTLGAVSLGKIVSLTVSGGTIPLIDASNMDTVAGAITPQIAGATRSGGDVSIECEYFNEVIPTGLEVAYSITPNGFAAITGNCIITGWDSSLPHDGKMTTTIKFTRVS